ncbi:hypothetical protein FRB96_002989 [Tulasnella sp. 330]|nr:hypothetical protein FRB96_002989 [Tulasnella sp. 330]
MKLFASALTVFAGLASLVQTTVARTIHESNPQSHMKRAHDLQKREFQGHATYFADGLGACGGTNGPDDPIVALNIEQWAGGMYCGKSLTITGNGKTHTATVTDQSFADESVGEFGITWSWDDGSSDQTTTSTKASASTSVSSTSSVSSLSTSSGTTTATASTPSDTSTPDGTPNTDQTSSQATTVGGGNITDQQKLVAIMGSMASYGKSASS